jgi:hypothetical protein
MAAEQWNEIFLQELVGTSIWERHVHADGFQKQEKETVGACEPSARKRGEEWRPRQMRMRQTRGL